MGGARLDSSLDTDVNLAGWVEKPSSWHSETDELAAAQWFSVEGAVRPDVRVVRIDDEEGGVFASRSVQVLVVFNVARGDEGCAGELLHRVVWRRIAFDGRQCLVGAVLVES